MHRGYRSRGTVVSARTAVVAGRRYADPLIDRTSANPQAAVHLSIVQPSTRVKTRNELIMDKCHTTNVCSSRPRRQMSALISPGVELVDEIATCVGTTRRARDGTGRVFPSRLSKATSKPCYGGRGAFDPNVFTYIL